MSDKNYQSPTTPGKPVTFAAYVVELVCLNMRPDLGPNFWLDGGYWAGKFSRECRGFAKFAKMYEGQEDDPLLRDAVVEAVKTTGVQSLLAENTLDRLDQRVLRIRVRLGEERARQIAAAPKDVDDIDDYMRRNARKVVDPTRTKLDWVRGAERSGKGKGQQEGGQQTLWEPSGVR